VLCIKLLHSQNKNKSSRAENDEDAEGYIATSTQDGRSNICGCIPCIDKAL
jgi:hypothetical protein